MLKIYTITKESDTCYSYKQDGRFTVFIDLCSDTNRWTLRRLANGANHSKYCFDMFSSLEGAKQCLNLYINKVSRDIFTCR